MFNKYADYFCIEQNFKTKNENKQIKHWSNIPNRFQRHVFFAKYPGHDQERIQDK